ncbi:uncharacterized LOC103314412 precursor [Tribolium castaneum]|uniref:Uncharacterized protein n=1 Tax=Tribolium castaneum TaxID=7070 RepID=A0A139WAW1_TRICA|nr:uncharacterized LOC103314412 precursor [Tribolium castaneum]KYB25076.1 hypothetical protein TcasGA2_TC031370 [Tribolium castaneum]|eukprot:XP_008198671.1 PREDICTED: uncharacterized protein LOC103314412 [Tribolium castaneum]
MVHLFIFVALVVAGGTAPAARHYTAILAHEAPVIPVVKAVPVVYATPVLYAAPVVHAPMAHSVYDEYR